MAAPDPYAGDPNREFTDSEWRQIAAAVDPGDSSFSGEGGGDGTLVGTKIPFNKLQAFYRYWVGWQGCSDPAGVNGITLQRTLPKRHPMFQELAAEVGHGQAFKPDSTAFAASPFEGLKRFISSYLTIPTIPFFTGYKYAKATIGFKDLDYDLLSDDQVASVLWSQTYTATNGAAASYSFPPEWQRFTAFDPAPRVETLSLDGFTMKYAEGQSNTGATTNPIGVSVPAPVGQLLVKADLAITTYKLPHEFLFEPQSILPRNILAGLGKVNRFAIFGQAAGTLLFVGVEMTRRRFSLRVPDGYTSFNETKYYWKVRYLFSFFDPPKGYNSNTYPTAITTNRGHNNLFYLGARDPNGATVSGDKNSMKWFFATASGNPLDPGLLPVFDVGQLWRAVSNTAGATNPVFV